jgi:hypothetical protein
MPTTTIWPASLPYDGAAYAADFGLASHEPATLAGNGSLSDGSDATSATLRGYLPEAGRVGSVVCVDFDPIPIFNGRFGTTIRLRRLIDSSSINTARWHVYVRDTATLIAFGDLHAAASPPSIEGIPTTTTWLTSGADWWGILDEYLGGVRSDGLTLAFSSEANQADPLSLFTVYEFGLLFNVPDDERPSLPPLRQHPRDDGRGTSSAARIWPPPSSFQGSARRHGYY